MSDINPKDMLANAEHRVDTTLFPDTAVIAGAMAMVEGDCVYGGFNYRVTDIGAMTYVSAADRHLKAWTNGENIDPKSGLSHLWKAIACIAILIDAEECGTLVDNRPPPAPVAAMLEDLKSAVKALREKHKSKGAKRYTWRDRPAGVDYQVRAGSISGRNGIPDDVYNG